MNWGRFGFTYSKNIAKVKSVPKTEPGLSVPESLMEMDEYEESGSCSDLDQPVPQEEEVKVAENDDISLSAQSAARRKKKKYKRYCKFNPKWSKEKQVAEILALRTPGEDGKVKAPIRDYLIQVRQHG